MPRGGTLARLKSAARYRPWYTTMLHPPSGGSATTMSDVVAPMGATSSSARVSRVSGPGQVN
jgi:hypothetical protein